MAEKDYSYFLNEQAEGMSRLKSIISAYKNNPEKTCALLDDLTDDGSYFALEGKIIEVGEKDNKYLFKIVPFEIDSSKPKDYIDSEYGNHVLAFADSDLVTKAMEINSLKEDQVITVTFHDKLAYNSDTHGLVVECTDVCFGYLGYVDVLGQIHSLDKLKDTYSALHAAQISGSPRPQGTNKPYSFPDTKAKKSKKDTKEMALGCAVIGLMVLGIACLVAGAYPAAIMCAIAFFILVMDSKKKEKKEKEEKFNKPVNTNYTQKPLLKTCPKCSKNLNAVGTCNFCGYKAD